MDNKSLETENPTNIIRIKGKYGTYVPLYEMHLTGFSEKDVPKDSTALFAELANFRPNSRADVESLSKAIPQNTKICKDRNIPLILGDAMPEPVWLMMARDSSCIIVPGLINKIIERMNDRDIENDIEISDFGRSRRDFIRKTAIAIGGIAMLPKIAMIPGAISTLTKDQNPVTELSARLSGMLSNFRPEDLTVFLRNVLMSHKLVLAAQKQKEQGIEKPVIPYNVGVGHGGMETMLKLDLEDLRNIILSYPKPVLKFVMNNSPINHLAEVDFVDIKTGDIHAYGDGDLSVKLYEIKDNK